MQCPACSSPIVVTIDAAAFDELDQRVCRSCHWSAYVEGTAHGRGHVRRSSPPSGPLRVSVGRLMQAFGPS
jgi:hypothetical protein